MGWRCRPSARVSPCGSWSSTFTSLGGWPCPWQVGPGVGRAGGGDPLWGLADFDRRARRRWRRNWRRLLPGRAGGSHLRRPSALQRGRPSVRLLPGGGRVFGLRDRGGTSQPMGGWSGIRRQLLRDRSRRGLDYPAHRKPVPHPDHRRRSRGGGVLLVPCGRLGLAPFGGGGGGPSADRSRRLRVRGNHLAPVWSTLTTSWRQPTSAAARPRFLPASGA